MQKTTLFRVLAGLLASLFTLSIGLATIANANETWMNSNLGTTNRRIEISSEEIPYYYESDYETLTQVLDAKYDLLERISEEGSVLLKNEHGALPLGQGVKVTLLGQGTVNTAYGGTIGSSITPGGTAEIVSLQQALNERGISVNPKMEAFYAENPGGGFYSSFMFGPRYDELDTAVIGEVPVSTMVEQGYAAESANGVTLTDDTVGEYRDAGIVVITRGSSEAAEYNITSEQTPDGDSYDSPLDLTTYEKQLIDLAVNTFDTVVVLLNTDVAMGIDYAKLNDGVDAILWVGLPGAKGFYGVADVLNGSVNPSGHLVDTYAVHPASAPANANMGLFTWANASIYGGSEMTSPDYGKGDWYVVENEGIYVGYKYYETRYADALAGDAQALNNANATSFVKGYADYDASAPWDYNSQVSYGFGYGLSYTSFTQTLDNISIDAAAGTGTAAVTISNTGSVDGKSAVQLYVQAPYQRGGVEKAAIQLVDFSKVEVAAGQSVTVELPFELINFTSFDETSGKWILDSGTYYFAVGNGAHEALNSILLHQGVDIDKLSVSTVEEQANAAAVCAVDIGSAADFLSSINANVESRLQQADWRTYDPDYQYITRSDWSVGWETIGSADGTSPEAISYPETMQVGLYGQQYSITANERTEDMNFDWNVDNGLRIYDFIGVPLDGTITKDGIDYTFDDLVNNMSLYEACFLLENEYQNLDAVSSVEMEECVTNDGPAGFAYDQVPGYAYNWAAYETYDKNYVSSDDENAKTSMALFNTEPVVASTWNKDLVYEEGVAMGEDALWADENLIIGPGVNLHRSAFNARNHEYYSEDSVLTSLMAAALCQGGYSKGLMMQPKHYAFNHQEVNRAGTATFFSEQSGRELELRCFQKVMSENLCQSIMTAFNRVGTLFAGSCEEILVGIARDEWGFEGFVVSDMVNGSMYMNWLDGFAYGISGMLATNGYSSTPLGASTSDENQALIATDAFLQQRIHDGVKYVAYQEANSNFMNGMDSTVQSHTVTPWWRAALLAAEIVTGIAAAVFIGLYIKAILSEKPVKKVN